MLLRYPGGKSKISHYILESLYDLLPRGDFEYREPFFGGGSIGFSFMKHHKKVWINDKDVGIASLWSAVIEYPDDLKQYIKNFTPSVESFYQFSEDLRKCSTTSVSTGFKKLVVHQLSYSGLGLRSGPLGGKSQQSKYLIDCRWSPKTLIATIDKARKLLGETRYNSCTYCDFEQLFEDSPSLLYLDPPYYHQGNQLYYCGFSIEDHRRLSESIRNFPHPWVLSYDDCDEIRSLYSWADIRVVPITYSINSSRDRNELLITGRK